MTPFEFAAAIKEKYPQYRDMDDGELVKRVVAKFPVYRDQIDFGPPADVRPVIDAPPLRTDPLLPPPERMRIAEEAGVRALLPLGKVEFPGAARSKESILEGQRMIAEAVGRAGERGPIPGLTGPLIRGVGAAAQLPGGVLEEFIPENMEQAALLVAFPEIVRGVKHFGPKIFPKLGTDVTPFLSKHTKGIRDKVVSAFRKVQLKVVKFRDIPDEELYRVWLSLPPEMRARAVRDNVQMRRAVIAKNQEASGLGPRAAARAVPPAPAPFTAALGAQLPVPFRGPPGAISPGGPPPGFLRTPTGRPLPPRPPRVAPEDPAPAPVLVPRRAPPEAPRPALAPAEALPAAQAEIPKVPAKPPTDKTELKLDDLKQSLERFGQKNLGTDPTWHPLEMIIREEWRPGFMFMGEQKLPDGKMVFLYKHGITRKYLNVDFLGNTYRFAPKVGDRPGSYVRVGEKQAIDHVYEGMEDLKGRRTTPYDASYIQQKDNALKKAGFQVLRLTPKGVKVSAPPAAPAAAPPAPISAKTRARDVAKIVGKGSGIFEFDSTTKTGSVSVLSGSTTGKGFRITNFTETGPTGHMEFETLAKATEELARRTKGNPVSRVDEWAQGKKWKKHLENLKRVAKGIKGLRATPAGDVFRVPAAAPRKPGAPIKARISIEIAEIIEQTPERIDVNMPDGSLVGGKIVGKKGDNPIVEIDTAQIGGGILMDDLVEFKLPAAPAPKPPEPPAAPPPTKPGAPAVAGPSKGPVEPRKELLKGEAKPVTQASISADIQRVVQGNVPGRIDAFATDGTLIGGKVIGARGNNPIVRLDTAEVGGPVIIGDIVEFNLPGETSPVDKVIPKFQAAPIPPTEAPAKPDTKPPTRPAAKKGEAAPVAGSGPESARQRWVSTSEEGRVKIASEAGIKGKALEAAPRKEWDALSKREQRRLQDGFNQVLLEFPTEAEQVAGIIRDSKSMAEAQRRVKSVMGLDLTPKEFFEFNKNLRAGIPLDISRKIMADIVKKIKQVERGKLIDFGVSEITDITPEEMIDSLSFTERSRERVLSIRQAVTEMVHSLELSQNYLYAYPDSRPVAEGIIDAEVRNLHILSDVNRAVGAIEAAPHKEAIARMLVEADKLERSGDDYLNVLAEVNKRIEAKTMTQADKAAIKGFGVLRKIIKGQLITDILQSRLGIRVRSDGIRYLAQYTLMSGDTRKVWRTESAIDTLRRKYPDLEVLDQKERVIFGQVDPRTGKRVRTKVDVQDWDEVLKMLGDKELALVNHLLPYYNWIPHNRIAGKFWVEVHHAGEGGAQTKIYAARVPNETWARKMEKSIKDNFPKSLNVDLADLRITVKPHSFRIRNNPSFGSMADVQHYLANIGVAPESEAGQRIMNAYRSQSPLMESLIHSQNLAGYRVDYDGIVEAMVGKARSAATRGFRLDTKLLLRKANDITDDFRYNVAVRYLNALSSADEGNAVLDAVKSLAYFWVLANKPTYIFQNLTEPIHALARMPVLNHPFDFMKPISGEYRHLMSRARKEGLLRPFFGEQIAGRGLLHDLNILGNWSEAWSSQVVFEIGLRIARDQGLNADKAYRAAYQFLFNVGKPYYKQPNVLVAFSGKKGWEAVNRYGFIFLRWSLDFINKAARGDARVKLKTLLAWMMLAGAGSLPFGRKILDKTGLVNIRKNPQRLTMTERALLGGIPGMLNVSPNFLAPVYFPTKGQYKGGVFGLGNVMRGMEITGTIVQRANNDYKKYGTMGIVGHLPLAGLQYIMLGAVKAQRGVIEVRGKKKKILFKPKTPWETAVVAMGLQPFTLSQKYEQRRD